MDRLWHTHTHLTQTPTPPAAMLKQQQTYSPSYCNLCKIKKPLSCDPVLVRVCPSDWFVTPVSAAAGELTARRPHRRPAASLLFEEMTWCRTVLYSVIQYSDYFPPSTLLVLVYKEIRMMSNDKCLKWDVSIYVDSSCLVVRFPEHCQKL